MEEKRKKVCFAASSGGHLEQLMMLRPLMEKYDSVLVTEKTAYHKSPDYIRTIYLKQVNRRESLFIFFMIYNLFRSIGILVREKPDVVISTGVLAVVPLCILAKLAGKKLVYLESFAKVTSPTISGKVLYRFADQFYVQWESMLEVYPKAIFLGGIY